jgi:hypothetical protein
MVVYKAQLAGEVGYCDFGLEFKPRCLWINFEILRSFLRIIPIPKLYFTIHI